MDYPVFESTAPKSIFELEYTPPNHLYWPKLDVDISVVALQHPENYPLYWDHAKWERDKESAERLHTASGS